MGITKKHLLILTALIAGGFGATAQEARAAFELNFQPSSDIQPGSQSNEMTYARCHIPGTTDAYCFHGGGGNSPAPDFTPFLREYVTIGGIQYVHMIVGSLTPDPVTGTVFAQETYVRASGSVYSSSGGRPGCNSNPNVCGGNSLAGGNTAPWTSGNGQIASESTVGTPLVGDQHTTGNGTGNPTHTVVRQVLKSLEMNQEFLKADVSLKPKITQTIASSDGLMSSEFTLDMSLINYSTSASGLMVNKLTLNDTDIPSESRFFDAVAGAQHGDVTGGRYTFASGAGWLDTSVHGAYSTVNFSTGVTTIIPEDKVWVYDAGNYSYSNGGGAGISNIDWQAFKNPLENP